MCSRRWTFILVLPLLLVSTSTEVPAGAKAIRLEAALRGLLPRGEGEAPWAMESEPEHESELWR